MFCQNCGQQYDDDMNYCPRCGCKKRIVLQDKTNTRQPTLPIAVSGFVMSLISILYVTIEVLIMALIGYIAIIIGLVFQLFGLVLGCIGIHQAEKQHNEASRGLAVAGTIMAVWTFLPTILFVVLYSVVL